jgi:catechol 2,3-dioxygenase-like lactoylglutathione lyase family enzyme
MNLEHVAFNVAEPAAVSDWYCKNAGMKLLRKFGAPAFGHFVADARGAMMLEFYNNPAASVPDYRSMNPLVLHIAFQVDDMAATRARLLQAGATAEGEVTANADGDQLAMLRDPWGLALQLLKRTTRMV